MTSLTPTDVLKQYAHKIQLAAPQEWAAFVECMDAYATDITVAVTAAHQNEILNQQGKAQMALHLLKAFRECHLHRTASQSPPAPVHPQP